MVELESKDDWQKLDCINVSNLLIITNFAFNVQPFTCAFLGNISFQSDIYQISFLIFNTVTNAYLFISYIKLCLLLENIYTITSEI